MEDHLKNKDRLMKEWDALCSYQAEPSTVSVAQSEGNLKKNRCPDSVPCEFPLVSPLVFPHLARSLLGFDVNSIITRSLPPE